MATEPDAYWTVPFDGRVSLTTPEMDGLTISVPVTKGDVCHVWTKDGELRGIINLGPPEVDVIAVPQGPAADALGEAWRG